MLRLTNHHRGSFRGLLGIAVLTVGSAAVCGGFPSATSRPQFVVEDLGTLGGERAGALAMNDTGVVVGWSETFEGVQSRFDMDAQGWGKYSNSIGIRWQPSGGRYGPGDGVLTMRDGCGGPMMFVAPAAFLGEHRDFYGGSLSYDYRTTGNKDVSHPHTGMYADVQLIGAGMVLEFDLPDPPIDAWIRYEIPLVETAGWRLSTDDTGGRPGWFFDGAGPVPTAAQFRAVLANLITVHLATEAIDGVGDTVSLDNVRFGGPPEIHAAMWLDGPIVDLGTLGGPWAEARDVNARGEAVGMSETFSGESRGFYAYRGAMHDLNTLVPIVTERAYRRGMWFDRLPLRNIFEANAINDSGHIVACASVWNDDHVHGLLLMPTEPFQIRQTPLEGSYVFFDLGRFEGAKDCLPTDLTERDMVVGISGDEAFAWDRTIRRLDQKPRAATGALGVNEAGEVVGWALENGLEKPGIWLREGWFDLPVRPSHEGRALDVNGARQAVGWTAPSMGTARRAMLWFDDSCALGDRPPALNPVDLNALAQMPDAPALHGYALDVATAIDRYGRVAGTASIPDGVFRAFRAVPIEIDPDFDDDAPGVGDCGTGDAESAAGAFCSGDVTGDSMIDFIDLLEVLAAWGPCPGCPTDINGDGFVDFGDLLVVLSGWGPCPE